MTSDSLRSAQDDYSSAGKRSASEPEAYGVPPPPRINEAFHADSDALIQLVSTQVTDGGKLENVNAMAPNTAVLLDDDNGVRLVEFADATTLARAPESDRRVVVARSSLPAPSDACAADALTVIANYVALRHNETFVSIYEMRPPDATAAPAVVEAVGADRHRWLVTLDFSGVFHDAKQRLLSKRVDVAMFGNGSIRKRSPNAFAYQSHISHAYCSQPTGSALPRRRHSAFGTGKCSSPTS